MTDLDDLEATAADYVLGVMDAAERRDVEQRRLGEPALDQAIKAWEARLAPLSEAAAEVAPPPGLFARIEQQLPFEEGGRSAQSDLRRRLRRWRAVAVASGALAACLAVALGLSQIARPPADRFVAMLQKDGSAPAFLVAMDAGGHSLTVRPLAAPADAAHSYELWIVSPQLGAPKSLGVIDQSGISRRSAPAYDKALLETATYAVSLEPLGGSPTGAPTGPVLFSGRLVPAAL